MAEKVADLYADLSIRGDDFDDRLKSARTGLDQLGKSADQSSERVRQSAIRSANAYERVRTEVDKAAKAQRDASQKATDAAEREKIAIERLADAERKHGQMSAEVIRAQKRVTDAHKDVERTAKAAEKATDQLTVKQRQSAKAASDAALEMRKAGDAMSDALPDGKKLDGAMGKLGQLGEKGSEVGGNFGGSFMAGFAPKIANLGSKGGPIGAAVAGVAVIGLAAGALLAQSISEGAQRQSDQNLIQAQLGLDEATTARLGKAASEAYMNNFGATVVENMDAIRAAMQSGLIPRDAGQGEMQKVAEQLSTVAAIMGEDIPSVARAAGQAVKTGMAKDAAGAMDLLVSATQRGLNISDDLLDTLNEYGTQFRKVGLDGTDAMGLIAQAVQNGARDTDVAADAIKEFALRVTDGSESTSTALQGLGLNVSEITTALAEGGEPAKAGLDSILDKLREMPPSVEKNQIAAALFGTQWEDLGAAFDHFDLSTARNELGQTAGAADNAAKTMADGPQAAIQQTRRVIEESTSQIKLAMAEAFGPAAQDIANGLMENKDQIVAIFADMVSGALTMGVAVGNVAAGLLHVWGSTAGELAELVGELVGTMGAAAEAVGGVISKIPGMGSVGDTLKSAGESAQTAAAGMVQMGDGAHAAANFIADELVPGMATARDRVNEAGDAARTSAAGMDVLRNSVVAIPDAKTIIISDNSPETKTKLEALGYTVTTLPDGSVQVVANTADAEARIAELQKPGSKTVTIYAVDQNGTPVNQSPMFGQGLGVLKNADGNVLDGPLPDQAKIQTARGKRGLIQWAEDETDGEAFIPLAPSKRRRSTSILANVADRFGFKLFRAMADGGYGLPSGTAISYGGSGFPDWMTELGGKYGVKPSTYAGHQESDRGETGYAPNPQGLNRGVDWSGSVAQMQAFAEAMMAQAASDPSIEQVIWQNPETGQKLGWAGRSDVSNTGYYDSDYGGHQDHVHTRFNAQVGASSGTPAASASTLKDITLDANSTRDDVARKIIAEGRKRGYTDAEIQAFLATALQESNLSPGAVGGGGAWHGVFQQDTSYPGRDDPNQNIAAFYDRMDEKKKSGGWSDDPYKNAFWLQQAPGNTSADAAYSGGRQGYYDEIKSKDAEAAALMSSLGPSVGTINGGDTNLTMNGSGSGAAQNVYVTGGRLDSVGSSTTTSTPPADDTTTAPKVDEGASAKKPDGVDVNLESPIKPWWIPEQTVKKYAFGDVRDGHSPEMVRPGDYRLWGEPESGGESYIPHSPAKRARALALWAKTGRILGVKGFASGGFGGYTADTTDAAAPANLYDLLALGVGAGFTAYGAISPYVGMATSGQVSLDSLVPQIDTSANDAAIVSQITGNIASQLEKYLPELLRALKENKPIRGGFGDAGATPAGLTMMRLGQ